MLELACTELEECWNILWQGSPHVPFSVPSLCFTWLRRVALAPSSATPCPPTPLKCIERNLGVIHVPPWASFPCPEGGLTSWLLIPTFPSALPCKMPPHSIPPLRSCYTGGPPETTRTHCPRSSTLEERGFFECLGRGGGAQVWGSRIGVNGGRGQRGSQQPPSAEPSPPPRLARTRGWPRRRGREGGPALVRAPLSERTCSAPRSPATLRCGARQPLSPARPSEPHRCRSPARPTRAGCQAPGASGPPYALGHQPRSSPSRDWRLGCPARKAPGRLEGCLGHTQQLL